jgi:hypothetical protein
VQSYKVITIWEEMLQATKYHAMYSAL